MTNTNKPEKSRSVIEVVADLIGLNAFFTRVRENPITAGEDWIVSPADCKVETVAKIGSDGLIEEKTIWKKKRYIKLSEMLQASDWVKTFEGGDYFKAYLSPKDLHYLRFPSAGKVAAGYYAPGKILPILFMKSGDVQNERLTSIVEATSGFPYGLVMIGSFMVNGMEVDYHIGDEYQRGDMFGRFRVGSTIAMLFPPGKVEITVKPGDKLKIGQAVARVL